MSSLGWRILFAVACVPSLAFPYLLQRHDSWSTSAIPSPSCLVSAYIWKTFFLLLFLKCIWSSKFFSLAFLVECPINGLECHIVDAETFVGSAPSNVAVVQFMQNGWHCLSSKPVKSSKVYWVCFICYTVLLYLDIIHCFLAFSAHITSCFFLTFWRTQNSLIYFWSVLIQHTESWVSNFKFVEVHEFFNVSTLILHIVLEILTAFHLYARVQHKELLEK